MLLFYVEPNLLLDSPKDIADCILEIDSWSVNWVSIKEVNQILKLECYKSSYTVVSYHSGWTLSNGSLNAGLYYSDRLHLVEKGNLKLAIFNSMFNLIEVSNDFICATIVISLVSRKNGCVF